MFYFLLSLMTSTLGSLIGIGGGIILRPILKYHGELSVSASALSTFTVFFMALFSTYRYRKDKKINYRVGGYLGIMIFPASMLGTIAIKFFSERFIGFAYILTLLFLIVIMRLRKFFIKIVISKFIKFLIIVFIGCMAGFLGIGGGPFLIPLLLFIFSVDEDKVFGTAVFIVLISSFFSLVQHIFEMNIDYLKAVPLLLGAYIGSKIGTGLNKKIENSIIIKIYNYVIVGLLLFGIYIII